MNLRQKAFGMLARVVTVRPGFVLFVCGLVTLALLVASSRLGMKTQFAEMMPQDLPAVKEYIGIIEDYSSDATVMLTLQSETKDIKKLGRVADDLAKRLEAISMVRPANGVSLNLGQKIALSRGKSPEGIPFDTIDLVRRIDYKVDREFAANHGFIIQQPKDLKNTLTMFSSLALPDLIENINNNFEKEFIEDSENLTTLDGEGEAVGGLEGIRKFLTSMDTYLSGENEEATRAATEEFILGPQYMLSPDNTTLLMMLQPAVSFDDFDDLMNLGYQIDDTLAVVKELYPDVAIGRTGAMMMQIDENYALANDFSWPTVFALVFILLLLISSFKTWKNPFLSVFSLIIGILWTAGVLAIVLRYLNMMSAGFGIVLLGLGIDFGIHLISGYRDGREMGKSVKDAICYMYERVGAGVLTGGLTTAIVFFSLQLTGLDAYAQMGVAMGTGIIVVLLAQMILLPALIVWDNKGYSVVDKTLYWMKLGFIVRIKQSVVKVIFGIFRMRMFNWVSNLFQFGFLESVGNVLTKPVVATSVLSISAILIGFSLYGGSKMEWEYDMMKLQPQNTPSQNTSENIIDKFELSPDFALVKANSMEECRELVEGFKKAGDRTGLIGSVDAITEFIPTDSIQHQNSVYVQEFRNNVKEKPLPDSLTHADLNKLVSELKRLHQNVVEIGEMSVMSSGEDNKITRKCDQMVGVDDEDSEILALARRIQNNNNARKSMSAYQQISAGVLKANLITMANPEMVTLENIPESIRERYMNTENDNLLISVYPKGHIWEQQTLAKFNEHTSRVTEKVTGLPAIMELLLNLMQEKGKVAIGFGMIAIALFLLIDFRSFKYTLLAMVTLAVGGIWMLGLMSAIGMKLSMMSFMGLPLIVGIGIDDGVHILHRYHIEGRGGIPRMLRFTGRAVLLTSLTTMIGFGSMGLASHPGIAQMGTTLFFGVGACFLSSVLVLPSLLSIKESFAKNK